MRLYASPCGEEGVAIVAMVFPYALTCKCGNQFSANLADAVNVERGPNLRQQILDGEFHIVLCPKCGRKQTAEKSFFYTDMARGTFIQVKPRHDRHLARTASEGLRKAVGAVPEAMVAEDRRKVRLVFGMQELREKLIAEDLNLDDRAVELLKVVALHDHPFLLQRPRLRLSLDGVRDGEVKFRASYDHHDSAFELGMPIELVKKFVRDEKMQMKWLAEAGNSNSILNPAEHSWVNLWSLSPQPKALDLLKTYAAQVRQGVAINVASDDFKRMLSGLPRGAQLPDWAKIDLQTLFDEARRLENEVLKDALFEIRFAKPLEDDWSTNSATDDIDTLWNLLKALPATHVEGNTKIAQLNLDLGEGGGSYSPQSGDIYIGERALSDDEEFSDVVRHEVGHGVHEKERDRINSWLKTQFGWEMLNPSQAGVDTWVGLMGGWDRFGITSRDRRDIPSFLASALGPGSNWDPGQAPLAPAGHGWFKPDFGPRLAYKQSGANWYRNNANWYRANGKAFFLNYWYRTLCVVNEDTLAMVARMPSSYASMSHFEFFAELYALYFDPDDPRRNDIPAPVMTWLNNNIGANAAHPVVQPNAPAPREEFEDVTRPKEY